MTDPSGFRKRLGVVIPSINTVVQAEFDAMRPRGVTNQLSRIFVRDRLIDNEDNLRGLTDDVQAGLMEAVDTVMTAEPHILVLGFSALALRDGIDGAKALQEQVRDRASCSPPMRATRRSASSAL
jgi:maleate isomerase